MSESSSVLPMDHIVILASDLSASLRFYGALLPLIGFNQVRDTVYANAQGIYLDFRPATNTANPYERYAPGLNHIGFTASSLQQIESIRESMRAQGFDVPEIQNLSGDHAIFFKDPDGMRIELAAYSAQNQTA